MPISAIRFSSFPPLAAFSFFDFLKAPTIEFEKVAGAGMGLCLRCRAYVDERLARVSADFNSLTSLERVEA